MGSDARGAAVWASSDGIVWTRAADNPEFDRSSFEVIAASASLLVAGGYRRTWTSTDAVHWSASAQLLPDGVEIADIVPGGPGFVMATNRFVSGGCYPEVWTSTDGRLWKRSGTLDAAAGGCDRVRALAAEGARLVAVGWARTAGQSHWTGSAVWISDDARRWLRVSAVTALDRALMDDVTAGLDGFVAVGQSPLGNAWEAAVWTSTDGWSWDRLPGFGDGGLSDGGLVAVAHGPGGYVAIGNGTHGELSWGSPDGRTWTPIGPRFGSDRFTKLAAFAIGFVAVGAGTTGLRQTPSIWVAPPVTLPSPPPTAPIGTVAGRWVDRAALPQARAGPTAAVGSDGTVYFFGGLGLRQELSSVVAYNPTTDHWTSRRSLPAPLVTGSAAVLAWDGRLYVFGEGSSDHPVYAYDPRTDTWTTVAHRGTFGAASGPDRRIYTTACGGICSFDPVTGSWGRPQAVEVRRARLVSGPGGRIYAVSDERIWSFEPATGQARSLTTVLTPRHDSAVVVDHAARIWIIGGGSQYEESLVEIYDPSTGAWARGPDLPSPRASAAAVVGRDGTVYVLGGQGTDRRRSDVLAFSPTSPPTPAPTAMPAPTSRPLKLSAWGTALIDGVASPGEWDKAARFDFEAAMPAVDGGARVPASIYVMNDATNLYLAASLGAIPGCAYNPTFEFDNDKDGDLAEIGNDWLAVHLPATTSGTVDLLDMFVFPVGNVGLDTSTAAGYPPAGTLDGEAAGSHPDDATTWVEIAHPLESLDDAHDFGLSIGDGAGFVFDAHTLGSGCGSCTDPAGCNGSTRVPTASIGQIVIASPPSDVK